MHERMEIIALLNELMDAKGRLFALDPVAAFVDALPYIPLRFKWPFLGKKKSGKDVEGYSPGFGNVSVSDAPRESSLADPKKYPDSRFGFWDVAHTGRGVYIDHMWSHHIMSPKFRSLCGLLLVRRDESGAIDAAMLLRQHESSFATWDIWKHSDNLSQQEMDVWLREIQPPPPQIVGRVWLPVLLVFLLFGIEMAIAGQQVQSGAGQVAVSFLLLNLLNHQLGVRRGWQFSFGSVIVGSVIVVRLLLLLSYLV